ncbi:hypothetical protein LTR62_000868 [Meristemomyces frigidus]|uniref:cyclin-dependent kinase n=1 Tax=Meristemomyces frigidus TaxID=1508187 RepID=A0AAN7TP60_9PEZI|nr:hypothetical protein LTR62_000868 [Meristemomyces frigidus]
MAEDWRHVHEYYQLVGNNVKRVLESGTNVEPEDKHEIENIIPDLLTPGVTIGRYTNAQLHNDGIFSEVFKATDPSKSNNDGNKVVALKMTTPDMMTAPHDSKREARILQTAKSDHIIPLLETFQQPGGHFILVFPFMPFALSTLLLHHHQSTLTNQTRRSIMRDIFTGLGHLHSLSIIHRDIKPSNILLRTPTGPAYLSDLGTAWSASDPSSEPPGQKTLEVGTTCYRAPELLFGQQAYDSRLDLWATGCVAAQLFCLNQQPLFDAGDLGSELALIKSMFETLGTPNVQTWPEAAGLPDWGKMNFMVYSGKDWREILPGAQEEERDLVGKLVVFESGWRITAREALKHECLRVAEVNG